MKIHRSQLPEAIAKALEPRTFAQERPEEGVIIDLRVTGPNNTFGPAKLFGNWWASASCYSVEELSDDTSAIRAEPTDMWRPFAVLEEEAPEPERVLPERQSYFIANGRLAYQTSSRTMWRFRADDTGRSEHENYRVNDTLPTDWQPLTEVLAKAARAEELEDELNQEQHARRHWEQCSESHCAEANKLEEKRTNQRAELAKQNAQIRELQAKLKQQDAPSINAIANRQYKWVERMGWHNKTVLEALALIASEVGEAVNECRHEKPSEKFGEELADIILRTLDLAEWQRIDMQAEIDKKMKLNDERGTRGRKV